MNRNPDFYLTAAGEYASLAEPRTCWVTRCMRDCEDNDYLFVEIRPPLRVIRETGVSDISLIVLSARQRDGTLTAISSWPFHVSVSRILDHKLLENDFLDKRQFEVIAWARLYPNLEGASQDAERYAAASRAIRSPETPHVPYIRFLDEQDGIAERLLKDDLAKLFGPDERIWKAYLVKVDFGPDTPVGVTLCLRTVMGPDAKLVQKVGEVFKTLCFTGEHLDILFIDDEWEQNLVPVCKPFYVRTVLRRV